LPEYTSSSSDDCTGTVQAGETKECTITNEYQPKDRSAQLIVIKNVVNTLEVDSDLVLKPSAFTIVVQGNDPLPRSFSGKSAEGVVVNLNPGRYNIFEEEVDGYTADYSESCQGTIHAEETRVCVITNEEVVIPPPSPPEPLPEIETISGFSAPYGIAFDPGNGLVYVSNKGQSNTTGTVSVINDTTNTIIGNLLVGKIPQAIMFNPANGFFYVANTFSNTLSIVNGTNSSQIGFIPVGESPGKNPTGIVTNSINNTVYVTNMGSNTVSVINGTTNAVVTNVTFTTREESGGYGFFSPAGIAYNSDNGNLYVANRGSDTISVINGSTNSIIDEISMDTVAPSGIIYNAVNNYIYVTSAGSNTVSVINGTTNAVVENIPVGMVPNGIAYDQSNGNVYVSNFMNGTISIIDGLKNNVTDTIILDTGSTPNGILYNPDTDSLFVADTNSSMVHVIRNP
jgi:YVTN family beta-propeller protein